MMSPMEITEKALSNTELLSLAKSILKAQRYKERSWDERDKKYRTSDAEAAQIACTQEQLEEFWTCVVVDWNERLWNEAQEWAERILTECSINIKPAEKKGTLSAREKVLFSTQFTSVRPKEKEIQTIEQITEILRKNGFMLIHGDNHVLLQEIPSGTVKAQFFML